MGTGLEYFSCLDAPKGTAEEVSVLTTLPYTLQEPDFPYASGNVPDAVCHFSYAPDGKRFKQVKQEFIARPELWIGAKFGFYCNRPVWKNDGGWVDVQDLKIQ